MNQNMFTFSAELRAQLASARGAYFSALYAAAVEAVEATDTEVTSFAAQLRGTGFPCTTAVASCALNSVRDGGGVVAMAMAKPRENPLNLYGWGVRINKGMDNERYVIRLGGTKYRADKKTSGKRSKGGGGRAYRVGSASSVQREVGRHLDARLSDQGYDTSRVERIAALAKIARGMENLIHK